MKKIRTTQSEVVLSIVACLLALSIPIALVGAELIAGTKEQQYQCTYTIDGDEVSTIRQ